MKTSTRRARPAAAGAGQFYEPHVPVGRADDGSWLFAPLGSMLVTDDGARVVCHGCGEWLSQVSTGHARSHGLTLEGYRERFGLNRKASLVAPRLAALRRADGLARWASNSGVREGLAVGQAMARSGELKALGGAAQPRGSRRRQGRLAASREGAAPALRAARDRQSAEALARWEAAAQGLGFADLDAYLVARRTEGAAAWRVRRELGCGGNTSSRLLNG